MESFYASFPPDHRQRYSFEVTPSSADHCMGWSGYHAIII
jgi:hypothetical protein